MYTTLLRHALLILALAVLASATTSTAQQFRLNAHGPSWHIGSDHDNNRTFGGGGEVLWQSGSWRYGALAGAYHNSLWHLSMYAGATATYQITDWVGIGMGLSAATGYDKKACYEMESGRESCFELEWARPVTLLPMPFVSVGKTVKIRMGGASSLKGGLMHMMVSVPLH